MYWSNDIDIKEFEGKVFKHVYADADEIHFIKEDGSKYIMYHSQDCCENVYVESIVGDLSDLIGSEILRAEERTNSDDNSREYESCTWTFYTFATAKGYVDIRWLGVSNGYYSERVSIREEK
jgi:hypothetical protein